MPTPHDALFKQVFTQPEHARGELLHVLPAAVARHVDWRTLRPMPGSFVDEELQERHADVLFRVRLAGRDALLYVLLEHKSHPDPWTPFQLLVYAVRVLERHRNEHPKAKKLPLLLAVVVHHSAGKWAGGTELLDLFDLDDEVRPDLAPWLPNLRFSLDDLSAESSAALRARALTALGRLALFCLHSRPHGGDFLGELRNWQDALLAVLRAPNGPTALGAVLSYIIQVLSLPPAEVRDFLRVEVGPEAEQAMTSTYDQLVNQGREEGRAEGRALLLLKQLERRFGELPTEAAERVRKASSEQLEVWAMRILDATTLAETLAGD